jgi:hypothetical protein
MNKPNKDDWIRIQGFLDTKTIKSLFKKGHLDKLSLSKCSKLTSKIAKELRKLESVRQLWLWCDVTRAAMRQIILIPNLEVLDILDISRPGQLTGFSEAENLKEFRANCWLKEADILAISSCHSLVELGVQNSTVSRKVIEAILTMPMLESIDLEASNFDDNFAASISESNLLLSLEVGGTKLTGKGLKHICRMKQLQNLDLWATNIIEEDLDLLMELPDLKYLSVGGYAGNENFQAETLIPRLNAIQSLERVWLDGVKLTETQENGLREKYKYVRITCDTWND